MGGRHRRDRASPRAKSELTLITIFRRIVPIIPVVCIDSISIIAIFRIPIVTVTAGSPGNRSDGSLSIR